MCLIRLENPADHMAICHVHTLACKDIGYGVVVVLGHPHYYPRLGFTPAKPYGIVWEHDAPEEAFMVQELRQGVLAQIQGVVRYRPEFDAV